MENIGKSITNGDNIGRRPCPTIRRYIVSVIPKLTI